MVPETGKPLSVEHETDNTLALKEAAPQQRNLFLLNFGLWTLALILSAAIFIAMRPFFFEENGDNSTVINNSPEITTPPVTLEAPLVKPVDRNSVWYRNNPSSRFVLLGHCDGGEGNFSSYCALKDTLQDEILQEFSFNCDKAQPACISAYSRAYLGKENDSGVTVLISGEFDSRNWGKAYRYDTKTSELLPLAEYSFFQLDWQNSWSYLNRNTPECANVEGFDNICHISPLRDGSIACNDFSRDPAYTVECLANLREISPVSLQTLQANLNALKKQVQPYFELNRDEARDFYFFKAEQKLISTDQPECLDTSNPKAYEATCLNGLAPEGSAERGNQDRLLSEMLKALGSIRYPVYSIWQ